MAYSVQSGHGHFLAFDERSDAVSIVSAFGLSPQDHHGDVAYQYEHGCDGSK